MTTTPPLLQLAAGRKPRRRARYFNKREKLEIYAAANGICQRCNNALGDRWDAHHKIMFADGGETKVANGVAFCSGCHAITHGMSGRVNPGRRLNAEVLREILNYDECTGVFRWNVTLTNSYPAGSIAGTITVGGYRSIGIGGRKYQAHRLAWLHMTGAWPADCIDHINMNKADNRWSNLRHASHADNMHNTPGYGSSGFKGVHWSKQRGKWVAQITGWRRHLGSFDRIEDAHAAYCAEAVVRFGKFARG